MRAPSARNAAVSGGFTLTEVMVSAALLGIVLASVIGTMVPLYRGIQTAETAGLLFDTQSRIVDYTTRDIRACVSAKVENSGKRLRLYLPAGYESSGTLPSPDGVTNGLATYASPVEVVYETASNRFTRTSSTRGTQTLATLGSQLTVGFTPTILSGTNVPPITITVDVNTDTRLFSSPATAAAPMTRTIQPKLKATVLP